MNFPEDQINELIRIYSGVQVAEEGGKTYFLLPNIELPENCSPKTLDALFCPTDRDGYQSRLFFSEKILGGPPNRNWNGTARIFERNWFAISWQISPNQRLVQMIRSHIDAIRI